MIQSTTYSAMHGTNNNLGDILVCDNLLPNTSTGQFENFEVTQYGPKIIGTFSGKVKGTGAGDNSVLVGEFSVNL